MTIIKRPPSPSPAYIAQANGPIKTGCKGVKLVILDLNGSLVFRKRRGVHGSFAARPGLPTFLSFLFSHFKVMVWSSATAKSVTSMVDGVFSKEQKQALVACWGRETLRLDAADFGNKVQTYKNLDWVWSDSAFKQFSQKNTVIIDDSVEKLRQHPYNLIQVPEYKSVDETDNALETVTMHLKKLLECEDVSCYIAKTKMWSSGMDEITASMSSVKVEETPEKVVTEHVKAAARPE